MDLVLFIKKEKGIGEREVKIFQDDKLSLIYEEIFQIITMDKPKLRKMMILVTLVILFHLP